MRIGAAVLASVLGTAAHAEDTHGDPAPAEETYDDCIARRRRIYAEATAQTDTNERGRLMRTMPECRAPAPQPPPAAPAMSGDAYAMPPSSTPLIGSHASAPPAPPPIAAPYVTTAAYVPPPVTRPSAITISIEPVLLALATLGAVVERPVTKRPNIAIALLGGIGYTNKITIGETLRTSYRGFDFEQVSWLRLHAGAQVNLYVDHAFRGPHLGIEGGYKRFSADDTIQVLTQSAYFGWKWIRTNGFTASVQAGVSLVEMKEEDPVFPAMGWTLYREGTLNTVHLHMNIAMGWTL